jgi:outer membrane protein W
MKKQIWTIVLAMAALFFDQTIEAQSFEKGKATVSVGYGLVHVGTFYKKYVEKDPEEETKIEKYTAIPLALQAEYGLTGRWGLGISTYYEKYELDYSYKSLSSNERYNQSDKIGLLSFIARTNYHFGKKTSRFDPYAGFGLGFMRLFYNKVDWFSDKGYSVTGELRLGARYFVTKNIAASLELGLSTMPVHAGFTVKL